VNELDPTLLFERIAHDVPKELHSHLFIVGSLAAAYYHRASLNRQVVNTKDADVIIHPAGAITECRDIAERLLDAGWRRIEICHPSPVPEPADSLSAIRLHPPESNAYFIELLGLPHADQRELKRWIPCALQDGWYGIPCFRFMAILVSQRKSSEVGIDYAAPELMALANLLSHPRLGTERMSALIEGRRLLRSAKDLGRVLALAYLTPSDEIDAWAETWWMALERHFPNEAADLADRAGAGLRELISDDAALGEAYVTTSTGLLGGHRVDTQKLRIAGERLLLDVVEPLRALAGVERAARS
jgi:hypothetical protein